MGGRAGESGQKSHILSRLTLRVVPLGPVPALLPPVARPKELHAVRRVDLRDCGGAEGGRVCDTRT